MGPLTHLIHPLCRCLIALAACAAAMTAAVAPAESQAQLPEMGHRTIAAEGSRPLLTIMADFSDQSFDVAPTRHDAPFYANLLFGNGRSGGASLGRRGYFDDNSNGAFTFAPAPIPANVPAGYRAGGILGPYTAVNQSTYANRGSSSPWEACRRLPDGTVNRPFTTRCNVLMQAVEAGFPFRSFDDNGDACVTNDELTIMIVFAEPSRSAGGAPTGGQTESVGPLPLPGTPSLALCPQVANVGEAVPASTAAHELTHTLGAEHSYGSSCRNDGFTVMSCPLGWEDDRRIVHLDPFVKMKLGWLRPTLITTTTAACVKLRAVDLPSLAGTSRAYVIHDPARGPYEYYLLEYRAPRPGNYDGAPWGVTGLRDRGLAIWSVRIDPTTKRLLEVASYDGPGSDSALFLIPPAGTPGEPVGSNGLWSREDGTATLRWLTDGRTATRVSVQWLDDATDTTTVPKTMTVRIGGGTCAPPVS